MCLAAPPLSQSAPVGISAALAASALERQVAAQLQCLELGWLDGSAPEDVSANLGEINEAPRRSAPKPHADLQMRIGLSANLPTTSAMPCVRRTMPRSIWRNVAR